MVDEYFQGEHMLHKVSPTLHDKVTMASYSIVDELLQLIFKVFHFTLQIPPVF